MKLKFTINYNTAWGESMHVVISYHSQDGTQRQQNLIMLTDDGQLWTLETAALRTSGEETLLSLGGRTLRLVLLRELPRLQPIERALQLAQPTTQLIQLCGSRLRHRHDMHRRQPLQDATLIMRDNGLFILFDSPQRGPAPGQFAVWYAPAGADCGGTGEDAPEMLGSGPISE